MIAEHTLENGITELITQLSELVSEKASNVDSILLKIDGCIEHVKNITSNIDQNVILGTTMFNKICNIGDQLIASKDSILKAKEDTERIVDILSTIAIFVIPALHAISFLVC